jgi:hypothetical protein
MEAVKNDNFCGWLQSLATRGNNLITQHLSIGTATQGDRRSDRKEVSQAVASFDYFSSCDIQRPSTDFHGIIA